MKEDNKIKLDENSVEKTLDQEEKMKEDNKIKLDENSVEKTLDQDEKMKEDNKIKLDENSVEKTLDQDEKIEDGKVEVKENSVEKTLDQEEKMKDGKVEINNINKRGYMIGAIALFVLGLFFVIVVFCIYYFSYSGHKENNTIEITGVLTKNTESNEIKLDGNNQTYSIDEKTFSLLEDNTTITLIINKNSYLKGKKYSLVYGITYEGEVLLKLDNGINKAKTNDMIGIVLISVFATASISVGVVLFIKSKKMTKTVKLDRLYATGLYSAPMLIYYTVDRNSNFNKLRYKIVAPAIGTVFLFFLIIILVAVQNFILALFPVIPIIVCICYLVVSTKKVKNDFLDAYLEYLESTNYVNNNKKIHPNIMIIDYFNKIYIDIQDEFIYINPKEIDNAIVNPNVDEYDSRIDLKNQEAIILGEHRKVLKCEINLITKYIPLHYLRGYFILDIYFEFEEIGEVSLTFTLNNKLYHLIKDNPYFNIDFDSRFKELKEDLKNTKYDKISFLSNAGKRQKIKW